MRARLDDHFEGEYPREDELGIGYDLVAADIRRLGKRRAET